jgi:hypothetical protein
MISIQHRDQPAYRTHEALVRLCQYMFLASRSWRSLWGSPSARISAALRPSGDLRRRLPFGVVTFPWAISTPAFLAKACWRRLAIFISDADRRSIERSITSAWDAEARCHDRQPPRCIEMGLPTERSRLSRAETRWRSSSATASIIRAGISSQPISSKKSACLQFNQCFRGPVFRM